MAPPCVSARGILHRFVGVTVDDLTYRRLCYLALAFPLGICYLVVLVTLFALGAGLAVVLVGIPILAVAVGATVALAAFERLLTRHQLGVQYETPTLPEYDTWKEFVRELVVQRRTVLGLCYLLGQFLVGTVAFVLLFLTVFTGGFLLLTPLYYEGTSVGIHLPETIHLAVDVGVGWGDRELELVVPITIGSWVADSLADAIGLSAVGLCFLVASLHLTNLAGRLLGRYARLMLS